MSRYLVNARNQAESTKQSRFPLHIWSFAWLVPHTHVAFSSEPSHNLLCATILDIISTSYACMLSLWRARLPPPHDARDRARSRRSLNILMAREPMGLSSRSLVILWASYRMALSRERKNSSRIAREIEIFSILLSWSPRFAQKQVQIWGRCFSLILGFRPPNFAQRNTLVYWNRINRHFCFWERKYREMEFRHWEMRVHDLHNEMVSYTCKDSIMIPWVFGLLVKVGETHAIDQGLIPGSSWLRQKSGVGQGRKLQFWKFLLFINLKF